LVLHGHAMRVVRN